MEWFNKGGVFMLPLLIESIVALYIIFERTVYFVYTLPRHKLKLLNVCKEEAIDKQTDESHFNNNDVLVAAIVTAKADKILHLEGLYLALDRHLEYARHNLTALNVVVQTAPLFGLLGTVTGMIQAFLKIQNLHGQVNPSDLAGGIWEALITTAVGLTIAIPALIAYIFISNRIAKYETWVQSVLSSMERTFRRNGWEVF